VGIGQIELSPRSALMRDIHFAAKLSLKRRSKALNLVSSASERDANTARNRAKLNLVEARHTVIFGHDLWFFLRRFSCVEFHQHSKNLRGRFDVSRGCFLEQLQQHQLLATDVTLLTVLADANALFHQVRQVGLEAAGPSGRDK
jgi:hypothetical protein